jgi:aromatic ring hydroxylase
VKTRLARATWYRLKAEETRAIADTMKHSAARTTMVEIAATYDRLADQEEKKDGPPSN